VNLDNVSRDEMIVGGLAILLAICLLFFPWFDVSVSVGAFSASATFTATGDPDGWLGILAVIAALAVVADLAVEKFSPQTQIPEIGGSRANTRFILAAIAAGFVVLKFLFHIHFSLFGWGFYVTVVVTAALVYFAAQIRSAPSMASAPTVSRPGSPPPPPPPPADSAGTAAPPQPGTGAGTAGSGTSGSTPPPGS
jgi:hypothetical protein